MSAEENKALVRRLIAEVIDAGRLDLADELLSPDFVLRSMGKSAERRGPDAFTAAIRALRAAWAELRVLPVELIAEGDLVGCQVELSGRRHQGAGVWRGIPPTGRDATWTGYRVMRVVGGRIAEIRAMEDELGLLTQLGATVTPPLTGEGDGPDPARRPG